MYIMHGILLYVWQLHHLTYFKMLKIFCIKLFSMKIYLLIFLSIFREYWLKSGDVLSKKNPNFGRHLGFLSIRVI